MRSLTPASLLAALAAIAATPWMAAAAARGTFGGRGPGNETEPNDRLFCADRLGLMPAHNALAVWGDIAHRHDLDVYRVDVLMPTALDIRVVTGAASLPIGGSGTSGSTYTASFIPIVQIYGPDGRFIFSHISAAPTLLLLDVAIPLINQSFYIGLSAFPGSLGPYGLQVTVH